MHVSLDFGIILDLFNQVFHAKLTIEGQGDSVDIIILEAGLVTAPKLSDELAVNFVVFVQV